MRKFILNCSIIAILIPATFLVTSAVMARGKRKMVARIPPVYTGTTNANARGKIPPVIAKQPTSSAWMHKVQVALVPNGIQIHAEVSIQETRPQARFVWVVRLLEPATKKILSEKRYDHQVFTVPIGDEQTFTFNDVIPAPNGRYIVEAGIHEIHATGLQRRAAGRGKITVF